MTVNHQLPVAFNIFFLIVALGTPGSSPFNKYSPPMHVFGVMRAAVPMVLVFTQQLPPEPPGGIPASWAGEQLVLLLLPPGHCGGPH